MLKFNEDAPLRQEDYLAMAEENRHLHETLERWKKEAEVKNAPEGKDLSWRAAIIFGAVALVMMVVGLLLLPGPNKRPPVVAADPGRQTTCYFGAPTNSVGERSDEPWRVNWGLYKSPCEHCDNVLVGSAPNSKEWFHSRDEVWQFIQKWNLDPCR